MEETMTEEAILQLVREKMKHRPKIVSMFENCYQDTLEKTVRVHEEDGTAFMLTGDIPAMWLRDSTNQLRPYLLVAKENERVAKYIEGVFKKQCLCILSDPYANAFNEEPNGMGHQSDLTRMAPDIWERKYEIDSLCYPVQLAYLYWKNTDRTAHFNGLFLEVMQEFGVRRCYYGHIHAQGCRHAFQGDWQGVHLEMVSADFLGFCPKKIG